MKKIALLLLLPIAAFADSVTYTINYQSGLKAFEVVTPDFIPKLPQFNSGLDFFASQLNACYTGSPDLLCTRVHLSFHQGLSTFTQYLYFVPDPFLNPGPGFSFSYPTDLSVAGRFQNDDKTGSTLIVQQRGDAATFAPEPSTLFLSSLAVLFLGFKYCRGLFRRACRIAQR
jgi:hypothetical protein